MDELRMIQRAAATMAIAILSLLATTAASGGQSLELVAVPRFATCGVYVKYGDGDFNSCKLQYRKKGEPSWSEAYPPVNVRKDPLLSAKPIVERMFRGCVVNLDEDCDYELKAEAFDSKGVSAGAAEASFRTWSPNPPVKKIVNISKELKAGPLEIAGVNGSPDGWIKYVADPDFTVEGGESSESAVLIKKCSYLILEGIKAKGGDRHCFYLSRSDNIRLVNCDVSGWGRPGVQNIAKGGKYYDQKGRSIDYESGFNVIQCSNLLIERCYAHDPRGRANSWFYSHPEGPQGISLNAAENTVVRYCAMLGSDEHRWNDAIGGYSNDQKTGGFFRDAEIYGNMLALGNDDGIELDGGQMNCCFFGNKIEGTLCGVSLAPNMLGPSYVFNNLIVNLADVNGTAGAVFKNGGGPAFTAGKTFFFNNTAWTKGDGLSGVGFSDSPKCKLFIGQSRNNILACSGTSVVDDEKHPDNDFDYDLLCNKSLLCGPYVRAAKEMERHAIIALPKFAEPESGDFRLSPGSPAIGAGQALPGFAFRADGANPDLGAFKAGEDEPIPALPLPLRADKAQVDLTVDLKAGSSSSAAVELSVKPGAQWKGRLSIVKNLSLDWLSAFPCEGMLSPETPLRFEISVAVEKVKSGGLLKGVVLARTDDGYFIPISVYAKAKDSKYLSISKLKDFAEEGPFTKREDEGSLSGKCFDFDSPNMGEPGQVHIASSHEIPAAGTYYLFLRVKSVATPVYDHNSLYVAIDGGAPQKIFFENSAEWIWAPIRLPSNKVEPGTQLILSQGRHSVKIFPRKTLLLDALAISSDPIIE